MGHTSVDCRAVMCRPLGCRKQSIPERKVPGARTMSPWGRRFAASPGTSLFQTSERDGQFKNMIDKGTDKQINP